MMTGWLVTVRYLGPTNYRGSRWVATADHPIGRAVVPYAYDVSPTGYAGPKLAADALIARWAADYAARYPDAGEWPYAIVAAGHGPQSVYGFIVARHAEPAENGGPA